MSGPPMTAEHFEVLLAIDGLSIDRVPASTRAIARQSGISAPAVEALLADLREAGHVSHRPDMYGGFWEQGPTGSDLALEEITRRSRV